MHKHGGSRDYTPASASPPDEAICDVGRAPGVSTTAGAVAEGVSLRGDGASPTSSGSIVSSRGVVFIVTMRREP